MATDAERREASHPATDPDRLQELTNDPELWPLIAANPNAYASLVAWLGENGGADVQAAIATRYRPVAAPAPAQALPVAQPRSNKGLWITLSVLVFLLVSGGAGAGVWAVTRDDDTSRQESSTNDEDKQQDDKHEKDEKDEDRSDDEDEDQDDRETSTSEIDCDDLSDLIDAAGELTSYFVGIDEEDQLTDAIEVIEEYEDHANRDVADAVELLLEYADAVEENPDDLHSATWGDALEAEFDLIDLELMQC